MNVVYDLDYDFDLYPAKTQQMLTMIKLLIGERIFILKDEMEVQEDLQPSCIVIHFSDINSDFWIGYIGYEEEFKNKLKASLDEDYQSYILKQIQLL